MLADTETHNLHLFKIPALLSYTFDIRRQIHFPLSYTCAKCQHSSVKHVPYVSRKKEPYVIIEPNASTPELQMCHISADT